MTTLDKKAVTARHFKISLDTWPVLAAFLAALLIRIGVIEHVTW
jgi:hypothetical protein